MQVHYLEHEEYTVSRINNLRDLIKFTHHYNHPSFHELRKSADKQVVYLLAYYRY